MNNLKKNIVLNQKNKIVETIKTKYSLKVCGYVVDKVFIQVWDHMNITLLQVLKDNILK